ncbi:hypothetical protein ACOME3_003835 [Neoechinorhynchus agilis]
MDDAVFQLYMLLLGHMEEHPLSTVQLNRYSNNNESHEEAADTFKTLLCIRCFQYDCVHHLEKSIRRRLKPSSDVSDETPTSDCDELDFLQQIMEGVADEKLDVADRLGVECRLNSTLTLKTTIHTFNVYQLSYFFTKN